MLLGEDQDLTARARTTRAAYSLPEYVEQVGCVLVDKGGYSIVRAADGGSSRSYVAEPWAVRRLTPRECERLQGFPDDFTRIPYRGKPAENCPDGPRYKALGNSWAVNVAEWVGERIGEVDGWALEVAA